jgi:PAS domain S-box-containing protein
MDSGSTAQRSNELPRKDLFGREGGLLDALRQSTEVLRALPVAIYITDAEGRLTFHNAAAVEFWGMRPEIGRTEWCGSWRLFWPDGRPMPHDECPMAVALKEGRALAGAEAVAERPDGTRVPFLAYPTPLRDASGRLVGAVNMLIDISERKHAEHATHLLAAIVESSDDAIASKDLNGIITSWNRGAEQLFGYAAEEAIGQPVMMLIPSHRRDEEAEILSRIRRGERVEHYETVRQRRDGSAVAVSLTVSPIRNAHGEVVGASKIARDISDRRRAEEQLRVVLREMGHRVKNLFALASSVVGQSAHWAKTPEDMADTVKQRLAALARAHELMLPGFAPSEEAASNRSTHLDALVRTMLSPYSEGEGDGPGRITVTGPEVLIDGNTVTSFALLLHEFATNATKYGALSAEQGRVTVEWSVEAGRLNLTWREEGGPPVKGPPRYEGFGSVLAANTVMNQFAGELSREWRREGLVICLSVPIDRFRT